MSAPKTYIRALLAFVEDNLFTVSGGITHHGDAIVEDEDLTPTI